MRLIFLVVAAEPAQVAPWACVAALEDVDIEAICSCHQTRILCVELGQDAVAIRRRTLQSRKLKLELVVSADDDVEVLLGAAREMLELTLEKHAKPC